MRFLTSWRVAAPLSVVLALVGGCAASGDSEPAATASAAGPVAFTNCGTSVTVPSPPARAVTMNQSATEIMLALGLEDRMAGTAYLDDEVLPEYAAAYAKVPVLAEEYPSKEKLLELAPDFVYGSFSSAFGDEGAGDRADWQKLGVGTYISAAGCPKETRPAKLAIDDVFAEIREIAAIFGVADRAETLIAGQKQRIVDVSAGAKGTGVLWWDNGTDAPSAGACCGSPAMIMSAAGVTNIFDDLTGNWADTNWETVVERNPDVIVLIDASWDTAAAKQAFLEKHPALKDLPAVKGKRYVTLPFSSTSAGVRNVLAVEALARGVGGVSS
ncbi:ABC transporter substrate-binding protein [Micromonospora craniellae]|uniref:Putative F420-0 ABC transporter substrate-binding protein n=1 Tax=Micromonospora craniellae TaxID=2294034 RepID=A0A372FS87_9ACTN|nr:ABC transporter substrate-binding protein [Micromonospora craniellae]QOC92302.1 ABC transporter substrate-binding protein [Micromonospora craniellae]RFS43652.1 putative F420-0 ABC transporter substrate-binding protein [Micromonospora craniellae]